MTWDTHSWSIFLRGQIACLNQSAGASSALQLEQVAKGTLHLQRPPLTQKDTSPQWQTFLDQEQHLSYYKTSTKPTVNCLLYAKGTQCQSATPLVTSILSSGSHSSVAPAFHSQGCRGQDFSFLGTHSLLSRAVSVLCIPLKLLS